MDFFGFRTVSLNTLFISVESAPRVSYTKHEYIVNGERMKSISILDISDPPPTINILGLNIISVVNDKAENEVLLKAYYIGIKRTCVTL